MKSVIVTGATSFIGVSLTNQLIQKGFRVLAVVRPNSPNLYRLRESNALRVIELDMDGIMTLPKTVSKKQDMFFHLAWEGTRTPYRDSSELQEKNYICSMNAVAAAAALESGVFIGIGSQAEYGNFNGRADENYRTKPLTEYGKAKLKAFRDGSELANRLGMDYIWSRIFSVYGEYDYPSTLVMSCIRKMLNNEDIPLSHCVQKWDYIYVDDVASALCKLGEKGRNGEVYNIASGFTRPLKQYVLEIRDIIGSSSKLDFGAIPYDQEGPVNLEPVVDKLKNELNWITTTDFETGVKRVIQYMKGEL